jgi:hypothetical protein
MNTLQMHSSKVIALLHTHLANVGPANANTPAFCQGRPKGPSLLPAANVQLGLRNCQPILEQADDIRHSANQDNTSML